MKLCSPFFRGGAIMACALFLAATEGRSQTPAPAPPGIPAKDARVLKIALMRDGRVTADGSPITLEALGAKLADLAKDKGVVWYYREGGKEEPHPNAMAVIRLIMEQKLPIKLSTKPDYSDAT